MHCVPVVAHGIICWVIDPLVVVHGLSCSTACVILIPPPGIKPMSSAWQGRFLTTEPPGKIPNVFFTYIVVFLCIYS